MGEGRVRPRAGLLAETDREMDRLTSGDIYNPATSQENDSRL